MKRKSKHTLIPPRNTRTVVMQGGAEQNFYLPNHPEWQAVVDHHYKGNLFRALIGNGWDADQGSAWLILPGIDGGSARQVAVSKRNGGYVVHGDCQATIFKKPEVALKHAAEQYLQLCQVLSGKRSVIERRLSTMQAKDILSHPLMAISGRGYWSVPVNDWVDSKVDATLYQDAIMPWNMPHHGWMRVSGIGIRTL